MKQRIPPHFVLFICACSALLASAPALPATDQPQWGQAWTRNLVSSERGLPDSFDPKTGKNVKWVAKLGTQSHGTPIVAGGRVYIGTNNEVPRDPKHKGDRGVLMCFDEKDGHLLWQLVVPKRDADKYYDWPKTGMSSPVTIEGNRAYFVDNRGEVICLDVEGMANGNDGPFRDEGRHMSPADQPPLEPGPLDADIIWAFDMPDNAGTWPHDGAHSSILIRGNHLYINTGTGVDNTHKVIRTPDAPSLIVLDKRTGRYLARDDEHIAPNIFHATWSSPSLAKVNGKDLIFFCGGNGVVYAFEPIPDSAAPVKSGAPPAKLKKVWQFDIDPEAPKDDVHTFLSNRITGPSNIYGMPVFYDGSLYVAGGGDIFWGKNEAWLKCIDPSGTGDITKTGLRWYYPLNRHTMSTAAIVDGLVYVADTQHTLHCVDAKSGTPYWTHDIGAEVWASPYVADGKVYIGNRRGGFWVMAAGKEEKELSHIELTTPISGTVTAANGVLYLATMTQLYAIAQGAISP